MRESVMKEEAILRIVDRLVQERIIPDTTEARSLAETTVKTVTRRRVIFMVSKAMEKWLQIPEMEGAGIPS